MRAQIAVSFTVADLEEASALAFGLRDIIDNSDALICPPGEVSEPWDATAPWPKTVEERESFLAWQHDVADGATTLGWQRYRHEVEADQAAAEASGTQPVE